MMKSEAKARKLEAQAISLKKAIDSNFFDLGRTLAEIRNGKHYVALGFSSFSAWMDARLSIGRRTVYNMISCHEKAVRLDISPEVFKGLGLHKTNEVLINASSKPGAVSLAKKATNLTYRQLREKTGHVVHKGIAIPAKKMPEWNRAIDAVRAAHPEDFLNESQAILEIVGFYLLTRRTRSAAAA